MELARFNDHCPKCPEDTETPIHDQIVHLRGNPGLKRGETPTPPHSPKVIEGTLVKS